MVQWVKCLLFKCKDRSSDPQDSRGSWTDMVAAYDPSTGEVEAETSPEQVGWLDYPELEGSVFAEKHCPVKKIKAMEKTPNIMLGPLDMCTHTYKHIKPYAHLDMYIQAHIHKHIHKENIIHPGNVY